MIPVSSYVDREFEHFPAEDSQHIPEGIICAKICEQIKNKGLSPVASASYYSSPRRLRKLIAKIIDR